MKTLDELVMVATSNLGIVSAQMPTVDSLVTSFRFKVNVSEETATRRLLATCLDERKAIHNSEFFMVYREGGRAPAFKHGTKDAATAEAKRIARESGETTHVLAAVETIQPNAMPTPEEFARHASSHPYGPTANEWGLWRVCVDGKMPAVIAVRCGPGGPYASCDSPGGSCLPSDGKWFPLDANGKDVDDDGDIPF